MELSRTKEQPAARQQRGAQKQELTGGFHLEVALAFEVGEQQDVARHGRADGHRNAGPPIRRVVAPNQGHTQPNGQGQYRTHPGHPKRLEQLYCARVLVSGNAVDQMQVAAKPKGVHQHIGQGPQDAEHAKRTGGQHLAEHHVEHPLGHKRPGGGHRVADQLAGGCARLQAAPKGPYAHGFTHWINSTCTRPMRRAAAVSGSGWKGMAPGATCKMRSGSRPNSSR